MNRVFHKTSLSRYDTRKKVFAVSALDLMSSCFYSQRDVVQHRSRLSPWIPWCHIPPIFAGDRPWRVQSSTASEHVASWWRGGGCGIGERATSKTISLPVLLFRHSMTSGSHCCDMKTGCQATTNITANLFETYLSIFKGRRQPAAFCLGTCCWFRINCDFNPT